MERTIHTRRVYQGRVVGLRVDTVLVEGKGVQAVREVVEHGPSVVVVPLTDQGEVLLVRQYRKPAEAYLLEAPAGGLEPGEEPEQAVRRELAEETGYSPAEVLPLGGFWMSPGFCTEYMHAFLAKGLTPVPARPEADESIQVVAVPLATVPQLLRSGEVQDAKTIAALLLALCLYPEAMDLP